MNKFRVGFVMIGEQDGWSSKPIIGDWSGNHPFIVGNGGRDVAASINVPPRFGGDPDLVSISGIVGYLAWTTHDRKANMRVQFHSEKLEGNKYSFQFNTCKAVSEPLLLIRGQQPDQDHRGPAVPDRRRVQVLR